MKPHIRALVIGLAIGLAALIALTVLIRASETACSVPAYERPASCPLY